MRKQGRKPLRHKDWNEGMMNRIMKKWRKEGRKRKERKEKNGLKRVIYFEASITRFLHATWLLSSEAQNKQLLSNSCKQICELFEIWKYMPLPSLRWNSLPKFSLAPIEKILTLNNVRYPKTSEWIIFCLRSRGKISTVSRNFRISDSFLRIEI